MSTVACAFAERLTMPTRPRKPRPSEAGKFRLYQDRSSRTAAYDKPPPPETWAERSLAYESSAQTLGQMLLGEPPVGRSALERARQLAGREFSARFMLVADGDA
jgi:hypothetical protein